MKSSLLIQKILIILSHLGTRQKKGWVIIYPIQYSRVIDNGSSFSLDCNKYCLVDDKRKVLSIPSKVKINAFKTLSGKIVAVYKGDYYETKLATSVKKHKIKPIEFKVETKPKWKPSPNHPWRQYAIACR